MCRSFSSHLRTLLGPALGGGGVGPPEEGLCRVPVGTATWLCFCVRELLLCFNEPRLQEAGAGLSPPPSPLAGFIKVLLYMAFMTIMIKVHTFPLFAIRPMYLAMR